jgi:hypothetical protein
MSEAAMVELPVNTATTEREGQVAKEVPVIDGTKSDYAVTIVQANVFSRAELVGYSYSCTSECIGATTETSNALIKASSQLGSGA